MKLDAARRLGEVRRLCVMINEIIPRWVRVLFAASLGALCLTDLDHRFYDMGKYTLVYVGLNYVVAASVAAFIVIRVRGVSRQ